MRTQIPNRFFLVIAAIATLLLTRLTAGAVTAEEFGFGAWTLNGQPVRGPVPLLVFTVALAGKPALFSGVTDLDTLIFDATKFPSINGYYLENSGGIFSWQRAGFIGPVNLDANETQMLGQQASDERSGLDSPAGIAYLLSVIAAKTGYNFAQWDSDQNGTITQAELSIMIIENADGTSGANRFIGAGGSGVDVPGVVKLNGRVATFGDRVSFMTLAHELSHSLGTIDLYFDFAGTIACWNGGLSTMSCTLFPSLDDRRVYHFDPWTKMKLGWVRPVIFELTPGGFATVSIPSQFQSYPPVLLYDPAASKEEYFIVEFRNNAAPSQGDYDRNVTSGTGGPNPFTGYVNGMAIWHAQPHKYAPIFHEGAPDLTPGGNGLWTSETPPLKWVDGTVTQTRLNPLRVENNGSQLRFEWVTEADLWVDAAYPGLPFHPELGTEGQPFNTINEALSFAPHGAILKIKTGSYPETLTIGKKLAMQPVNGAVTIGK